MFSISHKDKINKSSEVNVLWFKLIMLCQGNTGKILNLEDSFGNFNESPIFQFRKLYYITGRKKMKVKPQNVSAMEGAPYGRAPHMEGRPIWKGAPYGRTPHMEGRPIWKGAPYGRAPHMEGRPIWKGAPYGRAPHMEGRPLWSRTHVVSCLRLTRRPDNSNFR